MNQGDMNAGTGMDRRRALELLDTAKEEALAALYGSAAYRPGHDGRLEAVVASLSSRVSASPYPAAGYRRTGELAAACVSLAFDHPEEHDAVWDTVADRWNVSTDIRRLEGLEFLDNVLSLVCDDHDFVLVERDGMPHVRWLDDRERIPTISPDTLLDAISSFEVRLAEARGAALPSR